jgi:hypothetical protein
MKLSKLLMIALLAGTLGVLGCGDDPAPENGTGGTPSNGAVCDQCENQSDIPLCEVCYESCNNPDDGACEAAALLCCEIV